jgi:pyridoxine/pyridoxamine 5'-phosphate oxidase
MALQSAFDLLLGSEQPLAGMEDLIWQSLSAGASSKRHPWNEASFSTIDVVSAEAPVPKTRTVILRDVSREALTLDLHTDARSAKVTELECPNVCWTFYAPGTKVQLRASGTAEIINDERADRVWRDVPLASRSAYVSLKSPGLAVDQDAPPDTSDREVSEQESERGRAHFRIVRTTVKQFDWLYLRRGGQVRAMLEYESAEDCRARWLVP